MFTATMATTSSLEEQLTTLPGGVTWTLQIKSADLINLISDQGGVIIVVRVGEKKLIN